MSWQEWIVIGVVGLAAAYVLRHLWRSWGQLMDKGCAKSSCECGPREILGR